MGRYNNEEGTGSFEFEIPDNFDGTLYVTVTVTDEEGITAIKTELVQVNFAKLILNVNKMDFDPGDLITIDYVLEDSVGLIDYYYIVNYDYYSYNGLFIEKHFQSANAEGKLNFTIPEIGTADNYRIYLCAIDSENHRSENSITIYRKSDYILTVTLDKEQYERGDDITISYEIVATGEKNLPEFVLFSSQIMGNKYERFETNKAKGEFTYTIPDNVSLGMVLFYIEADTFEGDLDSYHMIEIIDDKGPELPHPKTKKDDASAAEEIADALGASVLDAILIVIIVVIIVLLFLMMRKGKPSRKKGKGEPKEERVEGIKGPKAKVGKPTPAPTPAPAQPTPAPQPAPVPVPQPATPPPPPPPPPPAPQQQQAQYYQDTAPTADYQQQQQAPPPPPPPPQQPYDQSYGYDQTQQQRRQPPPQYY
jgi:hypothetical protein